MEEKVSIPLVGLGLLVILVIATTFIPASWFGVKEVTPVYTPLNIVTVESFKTIARDNNNDGAPDWKTLLQQTYKESDATVNTTKEQSPVSKEDRARLDDPNNLTSSFAKNVYVTTAYMKQNNITDPATQQDTINGLLDAEASKIAIKLYTEKDLTVSTKEDRASLITYRDTIAGIATQAASYNFADGDLEIVGTYNTSKNSKDLLPLKKKAGQVDTIIKKMLATTVPRSAVTLHLTALNRLSAYKTTLEGLSAVDTDPVRSTLVARQYQNTVDLVAKSLLRFDDYFKAVGVPFTERRVPVTN